MGEVKKFKSALGSPVTLEVEGNINSQGVFLAFENSTILLAPSDAPALCLAILEAAGWPNEYLATTEILRRLRELDEHAKAVEAEARERAELEAEALELHNAFWDGVDRNQIDSWGGEQGNSKNAWIAAARRAREIAKETPNA